MPDEVFNPIDTVRRFLEKNDCASQIMETEATIFTVTEDVYKRQAIASWGSITPNTSRACRCLLYTSGGEDDYIMRKVR